MNDEETAGLLRKLIESFIDFPRDLDVDYKTFHGRTDFKIRGNISDQGKLVGRTAAHIKALRFILEALGNRQGVQYHLRLEDPPPGDRAPPGAKRTAGPDYRGDDLHHLLIDLLAALLDEVPAIALHNARDAAGVNLTFTISCQRVQDYEALVGPREGDTSGQTILTSLGTLFRAAGHRDGAGIKLEVPGR